MNSLNLGMQAGQIVLDGFPDDFQINFEIAVSHGITHLVGKSKRKLRMGCSELRVIALNVVASPMISRLRITAS